MGDTRNRIVKYGLTTPKLVNPEDGSEALIVDIIASAGGGSGGQVDSVAAGNAVEVDATDPANPEVGVTPAVFVANADGTDSATAAASVDALRDSLIAAGLMSAS